ncbi:MAG: hypothetical protein HYX69_22060 [Planctomycetia bacterium]|nr:hypothetical protein [Planctomycetia bacterium]
MRCDEFEIRLQQLLDERRGPDGDDRLAGHAACCEPCGALLSGCEALLEGVASWDTPVPTVDLVARVARQWRPAPKVRPRRRRVLVGLAMAATLLVAALPAMRWLRPGPGVVQIADGAGAPAVAPAPRPALVDEASATYAPLLAETRQSFLAAMVWLPAAGLAADGGSGPAEPAQTAPSSEAENESGPMAPVAESTGKSLMALLRVLPCSGGAE